MSPRRDEADTPPPIAIDDVACEPHTPPWEQAIAEGYAWGQLHVADFRGIDASRGRASALVDALAEDDPRYAEAHCRAGFAHYNLMNVGVADRHFRRAGAALRKRLSADAEQRYAAATYPAFSISLSFDFEDRSAPHLVTLDRVVGLGLDPDDCHTPDLALVELARAHLYRSANRKQIREVRRPKRGPLGSLAADTGAALQDEIEAALGPRHRLSLAMREHMTTLCEEWQERRFPKRCPQLADLRQRMFDDRNATLGEHHVDTRRSALFLGGELLAAGRVDEATRSFEQAAHGDPDPVWIAAQQLLAGLELDAGKNREGFNRLLDVAAALPTAAVASDWATLQSWRLHEQAAVRTGNTAEAERARLEQKRIGDAQFYVGPGGPSLAMIELSIRPEASALHEAAVYGLVDARTQELRRLDLGQPARAWRVAELDIALQCRALMRHRAGDTYGATDDLRALATLRSGLSSSR